MNAVTATAAVVSEFAAFRGLSDALAKDELLRVVNLAKESWTEPGRFRYRNNSDRLDVTARVDVDGCIFAVTVRHYRSKRGGSRSR